MILVYVDVVLFTKTTRAMGKFQIFLKGEYSLKLPEKAERFSGVNILCEVHSVIQSIHTGWTRRMLGLWQVGLLKELIKLPTRADNSQSAREVQGTGQARSMQRNTKKERNL